MTADIPTSRRRSWAWRIGTPLRGIALALLWAAAAAAQEQQVPFDTGGQIEVLTRAEARRLHFLIDKYPDLTDARLFRNAAGDWFLEVSSRRSDGIWRERMPLTPEEAEQMRRSVSERLQGSGAGDAFIGPRAMLIGTCATLGLGFYAWAVPVGLDVDDTRLAIGLGLLSSAAAFYIPFAATAHRPVSYGEAEMLRIGATRGIADGFLLWGSLAPEDAESDREGILAALGGSALGAIAGQQWARRTAMSPGTARMVATGSDFGMFAGYLTAVLSDKEDDRPVRSGLMLAGGLAAPAAVYAGTRSWPYSWGDAEVLRAAGVLGIALGATAVDWFDSEDDKALAVGALVGCGAGFFAGHKLVENTEFSIGQAVLIELGTLAGSVAALGLTYVVSGSGTDETAYLTAGTAGAIGGFAATYLAMRNNPSAMSRSSLELRLEPAGLAALGLGAGARWSGRALPLLSVTGRF